MKEHSRKQLSDILLIIGLLLMVVMAIMPLLEIKQQWMRWAYAAGALIVLAARIVGNDNEGSLRVRRLHRILISSGILYCASAAMMFLPDGGNNWIGFLLAGVVTQLYASWMIEREQGKSPK